MIVYDHLEGNFPDAYSTKSRRRHLKVYDSELFNNIVGKKCFTKALKMKRKINLGTLGQAKMEPRPR